MPASEFFGDDYFKDPELAALAKKHNLKTPLEKILRTEWLATALNSEGLDPKLGERVVVLACGHYQVTSRFDRMRCLKCQEILSSGGDYHGFRNRDE